VAVRFSPLFYLVGAGALATAGPVAAEGGYAIWHATSSAIPGTQVSVKDGDFIDRAYLRPAAAVRTLAPLIDTDKQRVILPAGASLALMSGARAGEYCTWNHGASLVPPGKRAKLRLTDRGGMLCVSVGSQQTTERLHYISGTNPLILREYGMDFARGAKHFNPVKVQELAPEDYPGDVEMGPVAFVSGANGHRPCMHWGMRATNGPLDVFSNQVACFDNVGQTLALESGRYTLLSWDPKGRAASIRIDRGFRVEEFASRISNNGY